MTVLDLTLTRVFDAPRELVFEVWTEPEHLARWWGPTGFTTPSCEIDLVEGGRWRTRIHNATNGLRLRSSGVYQEIRRPERLVFTFAWEIAGSRAPDMLVTVTFADFDGRTEMTFHQTPFDSIAQQNDHIDGWIQCFADLAAYLTERVAAVTREERR